MESRDITIVFCRICKNELVPSDVTTICDGCLFSLGNRKMEEDKLITMMTMGLMI